MLANRSRFAPRRSLPATLLATALASGCVPASAPAPAPPPPSAREATPPLAPRPARPAPPPSADWRDAPQSTGAWKWGMDGELSVARFGEPGIEPVATLTCEPGTHAITLRRSGNAVPGAGGAAETSLIVTTTGARQMFTATADPSGGGAVALAPQDPILDAMAFSRGCFMLEIPGTSTLYLPSAPELSRVIEDCREGVVHRPEAGPKP